MPTVFNIHTNMDPSDIHDALLDTFVKWISFSLGVGKLGGKAMREPSGRLASAIRAEYNQDGKIVALYLDPEAEEEMSKMTGHRAFSLKRRMLQIGKPGVRISSEGYLYRYVPISPASNVKGAYKQAMENWMKNLITSKSNPATGGGTLGINKGLAKMWVSDYESTRSPSGGGEIRTMSNKPGSAAWRVPAMPSYNVKRLLRQMIPPGIKDRLIL